MSTISGELNKIKFLELLFFYSF